MRDHTGTCKALDHKRCARCCQSSASWRRTSNKFASCLVHTGLQICVFGKQDTRVASVVVGPKRHVMAVHFVALLNSINDKPTPALASGIAPVIVVPKMTLFEGSILALILRNGN